MKTTGIYIDLRNKDQVSWFTKIASKLVTVTDYQYIVETKTGNKIGILMNLSGLFRDFVINYNVKHFIKNPVIWKG